MKLVPLPHVRTEDPALTSTLTLSFVSVETDFLEKLVMKVRQLLLDVAHLMFFPLDLHCNFVKVLNDFAPFQTTIHFKNSVQLINKFSLYTGYSGTSFLATFDTTPLTPENPIVFNYAVHNTGGHYDPTTGIYTTPFDGSYEFMFCFRAENDATVGAFLVVDGEDVSLFHTTVKYKKLSQNYRCQL